MNDTRENLAGGSTRPLSTLLRAELPGEEAGYFANLLAQRVPVAEATLVRIDPRDPSTLRATIDAALERAQVVRLRSFLPTAAEQDIWPDVEETLSAQIDRIAAAARRTGLRWVDVAVAGTDAEPSGCARSMNRMGDPDEVLVWTPETLAEPWRIDRRSTRVSEPGRALSVLEAEAVADLVDRVQLVLGIPVEIDWCVQGGGRPVVFGVRPISLRPTFIAGAWSRLALVAADEGTVAPLAIDALNRGLEVEARAPRVDQTVRRIYARPYRRHQGEPAKLGASEPQSLARAGALVGKIVTESAPVIADALKFERTLDARFTRLDVDNLGELTPEALMDVVRERHRVVAEALLLLDRSRELTRRGLETLEAIVGALPRECYGALAAPRAMRKRRRVHERLQKLRRRIEKKHGSLVDPDRLSEGNRKRWVETREDLADVRPLGIDVVPRPIGFDDQTLMQALQRLEDYGHTAREEARKNAAGRVVAIARSRSLGRLRAGLALSITPLLQRLARVKGGVSEGVADSLLLLRRAACEVGRRLVERAVLDEPDDALYLSLVELDEALSREPGAYAARVRFRREDDERWRNYDAPRRIGE